MHATEKLGEWGEGDVQRADADEEKGVHFFLRIANFFKAVQTVQLD